jgi:chemotaxis protein CheX
MEVRAEFVNPFIEAASLVFRDSLKLDLIRGKLKVRDAPTPSYELAIVIGVVGSYKGEIIYSLNYDAAYKMAKRLVPSMDDASIREEYKDIIGEIGNMTTGNALRIFAANGQFVDLTTPSVVEVKESNLQFKKATTLSLNLYSKLGQLEINIAIQ